MAVSKNKSKPAAKAKGEKTYKSVKAKPAAKQRKSTKSKIKKSTPSVVGKSALGKKSSLKKTVKNNAKTLVSAQKLHGQILRNQLKKIEKDTQSIMRPLGDLAVAMIEKVDDAITGTHHKKV